MRPGRVIRRRTRCSATAMKSVNVLALFARRPGVVPGVAFLAAAAHVGDGIDEPAVHQRQPLDAELGLLGVAVGAVAVAARPAPSRRAWCPCGRGR